MKPLTHKEIQRFINSDVDQDAVWNFLGTAHHCGSYINALCNLEMDAELYRWNKETVKAIMNGLKFANDKN